MPAQSIVCVQGRCVEGDCVCGTGYEGFDCADPVNEKYRGTYQSIAICDDTTAAAPYSATFTPAPFSAPTLMTISGLWRPDSKTVVAEVQSQYPSYTFVIGRQSILAGYEIECTSGSLDYATKTVTMSFKIYAVGSLVAVDACSLVLNR